MSERYKIRDQDRIYFVTFSVIGWIDVFTRNEYKNIVVESLRLCQSKKGLLIYARCIMSNHLHMIVGRNGPFRIEEIIRDFKKYTSVQLCRAIENNGGESRKEWMLSYFRKAVESSSKHVKYQFWQNEYHPIELSSNKMQDQRFALPP